MNTGDYQDCWRPTAQQENLLRAALLRGQTAIRAWEEWKASIDIENLDSGTYRLLPLLYKNMLAHEVSDPLVDRLKSVYRHTWSKNQMLLRAAAGLLGAMRERRIETIALKGAALASLYYRDWGARQMSDFDLLVPTSKARETMSALQDLGWKPQTQWPERAILVRHSTDFSDSGGRSLDLHWHLMWECCREDDDADFWQAASPLLLGDEETLALCSADQLLHVCVHGSMWNPNPPFRWAADAMMIIQSSNVDWNRLLAQTERRRLVLPVGRMLAWLRHSLDARVPDALIEEMQAIRVSRSERVEYRVKMRQMKGLSSLATFWFMQRRSSEGGLLRRLAEFPRYLQYNWGLERLHQVPVYMATRVARRNLRRMVSLFDRSLPKTRTASR
ncbi:MAG: nucleotidyltransferase family protein [Acidobacteriota bacterium]